MIRFKSRFVCFVLPALLLIMGSNLASAAEKIDQTVSIGSDGEHMAFNKKSFTVKAGKMIRIKFRNDMKKTVNFHNLIIVKPGTDAEVARLGNDAGDGADWTPETPDIIAKTKLLKPGEEDVIVFKAPPPGDYPYICTYPGHAETMKGVMHSKK